MADHTCATCVFIQRSYWGDASDFGGRTHFCGKSDERRPILVELNPEYAEIARRRLTGDAGMFAEVA